MVDSDTTFALLQLVALILPAVAIYLEILSSRHELSDMDDGLAANYHAIRLTFLYLLAAAGMLVLSLTSPIFQSLIGPMAASTAEIALTGGAIALVLLALVTFGLPVVFSEVGLSNSHRIWWPYSNAKHRVVDHCTDRFRSWRSAPEDDEA